MPQYLHIYICLNIYIFTKSFAYLHMTLTSVPQPFLRWTSFSMTANQWQWLVMIENDTLLHFALCNLFPNSNQFKWKWHFVALCTWHFVSKFKSIQIELYPTQTSRDDIGFPRVTSYHTFDSPTLLFFFYPEASLASVQMSRALAYLHPLPSSFSSDIKFDWGVKPWYERGLTSWKRT